MTRRLARILLLAAVLGCVAAPLSAAREFGPYPARVLHVVDGDTLDVETEIWPGHLVRSRVRLVGIDAPELHAGPACERAAAARARAFVSEWVARPGVLSLVLSGRDKYGRDLGQVKRGAEDLAEQLLAAGLVRPYAGGARGPWC